MTRIVQLIDWAEKFPSESPLQIAIRQSTVCPCGKPKIIGNANCGCGVTTTNNP